MLTWRQASLYPVTGQPWRLWSSGTLRWSWNRSPEVIRDGDWGRPRCGSLSLVSDVRVRSYCPIWPCLLPKTQLLRFFVIYVWNTNGAGWITHRMLIIEVFTNPGDFDICMYCFFNCMHNNLQSMQENIDSYIPTFFLSLNPVFHDATLSLTHTHTHTHTHTLSMCF